MDVDRPAPGEELRESGTAPTMPRQAATVILLRGGDQTLEVLLVKRNPAQRFMGGAWVFPGGAIDAAEAEQDEAHRVAGVRELEEEAGIVLPGPHVLVAFSRWITPPQVAIRFDTHFFLAPLPEGAVARVDGRECVDLGWFTPRGALEAYAAGEMSLVFPTIKHLEQLGELRSVDHALEVARGREVTPVLPRVVTRDGAAHVVLPGEPGYDTP